MKPPVFLLASERSGTNLLRRRFTEFQNEYYGPAPIHLLNHLYWSEPYYGDLTSEENFDAFVGSALGLAYHHFSPWDEQITVNQVKAEYGSLSGTNRSAVGVMHVIYSIYAKRKGYSSYFCKDNNLFDFVADIKLLIPEAKFIYLYRDPRDVIVSQLKRPLQNKSISFLADLWREEQVKCIRHSQFLDRYNDVILISYEGLIADEEESIRRLCAFLSVDKFEKKSAFSGHEKTEIQEWVNLQKPTIKDNSGKFLKYLTSSKIEKIEGICWHQMIWLGYEPISEKRKIISSRKVELDSLVGKAMRSITSRSRKSGTTAEQMDRIKYTRNLQSKWR
jgi:hypothetical protein